MDWKTVGWMVGVLAVSAGALYGWQRHREQLRSGMLEQESMEVPLRTYGGYTLSAFPASAPGERRTCADPPRVSGVTLRLGKPMTPAEAESDDAGNRWGWRGPNLEGGALRDNPDWMVLKKSRMQPGDTVRPWTSSLGSSSGFGSSGGFALFRGHCFIGDVMTWIS
jgi:hypothetical protein